MFRYLQDLDPITSSIDYCCTTAGMHNPYFCCKLISILDVCSHLEWPLQLLTLLLHNCLYDTFVVCCSTNMQIISSIPFLHTCAYFNQHELFQFSDLDHPQPQFNFILSIFLQVTLAVFAFNKLPSFHHGCCTLCFVFPSLFCLEADMVVFIDMQKNWWRSKGNLML